MQQEDGVLDAGVLLKPAVPQLGRVEEEGVHILYEGDEPQTPNALQILAVSEGVHAWGHGLLRQLKNIVRTVKPGRSGHERYTIRTSLR